MWKCFVLFCALATLASGQESTAVSQCIYSNGTLPINTYIEGCITTPCRLPQLQDVVLHLIFRAPHTIRHMRTLARAYVFGPIGLDHPLEEDEETCNFLTNTYCPVLKDEVIKYTLKMYIEPNFRVGVSVTIEFRIVDENDLDVICIRVPVVIISAITKNENQTLAYAEILQLNTQF